MDRGLMLKRARAIARTAKQEIDVYQRVLRDPRTPFMARVCLGLGVGYLLMPFDLIPDFIPVLGQLDDVLIVPGLILLALKLLPPGLLAEHRAAVREQSTPLGVERMIDLTSSTGARSRKSCPTVTNT